MTPAYPSRVDGGSLSGFSVVGTAMSKRWEGNDDEDEDDLSAELLLYTNIMLVTMVTMMMPPTPWH